MQVKVRRLTETQEGIQQSQIVPGEETLQFLNPTNFCSKCVGLRAES
jgi:hypothetical protein